MKLIAEIDAVADSISAYVQSEQTEDPYELGDAACCLYVELEALMARLETTLTHQQEITK